VAMLVAGSIGGLYSCQKKPQEVPAPALAPSPVEAVRRAFNAAGHDRVLTQAFGDSAKLRWEPDWRAAYTKPGRDGTLYTYVPLTPTLLAASTGRLAGAFRMVGTQRFLIAKLAGEAYSFDLATYTVAKPAAARHRTLAAAAAQPMAWAAFSGTMTLHGLTTEKHAVFSYRNGALVTPQKPAATTRQAGARATGSYDCITIYTCYWTAFCTRNGSPITYGAMTQGINWCDSPGQEACGIDSWGMSWMSTGTEISESCTYVDDPPVPDPTDPGNSGSGSSSFDETIDDSQLKPCMVTVLNDVKGLSNGRIADIITRFAGQSPTNYNWVVKDGHLAQGTNGATSSYDRALRSVTTVFDANQFQQATDLSIARTIMHESIHAYLGAFFADDANLANAAYSDMVMAYATHTNSSANDLQHDEMVRAWVQDIADALQQYGVSKGYALPANFYANLAWGGLEGTRAFKNLPSSKRNEIRDTVLSELNGTDSFGNFKTPNGSVAGC
jgi:hypothetical protein